MLFDVTFGVLDMAFSEELDAAWKPLDDFFMSSASCRHRELRTLSGEVRSLPDGCMEPLSTRPIAPQSPRNILESILGWTQRPQGKQGVELAVVNPSSVGNAVQTYLRHCSRQKTGERFGPGWVYWTLGRATDNL